MPKRAELLEGEEAAERFRDFTEKVMSVPKSEIDKRAAKERAKRDRQKTEEPES
ncbi:MAG TPA: hypothetical protein VNY07_02180 [Chthoniobacterales bacterium]|jgi:hypothetical protein|nr:hypothetical protein [Chthoniobacterales bacterium]